jgi:hypothetical protein
LLRQTVGMRRWGSLATTLFGLAVIVPSTTAGCSQTCTVSCAGPSVYVSVRDLPARWLKSATFTLCADSSCTSEPPVTGIPDPQVHTPLHAFEAPSTIGLTVAYKGGVVLRAQTHQRYALSKGGQCKCGGSIKLSVDRQGRFRG